MSVYVDDAQFPYGRMIMCHMVADTLDELHNMADIITVNRKWFQDKPNFPHYDISKGKRALAVSSGAIEITTREMIRFRKRLEEDIVEEIAERVRKRVIRRLADDMGITPEQWEQIALDAAP